METLKLVNRFNEEAIEFIILQSCSRKKSKLDNRGVQNSIVRAIAQFQFEDLLSGVYITNIRNLQTPRA